MYFPAPVVLPAASTIAMRLPIIERSVISALALSTSAPHALVWAAERSLALPALKLCRPSAARNLLSPAPATCYFAAAIPFCSASIAALMASYIWL